ncbi:MAG: phosphoribosylanthranilate isomerase [Pseudomonadales bacterium]
MYQRTRIKVCGITDCETALIAANAGVDAIGLVFYPRSSRFVELQKAADILAVLPPFVTTVALFVDPDEAEVNRVVDALDITCLQFHGKESGTFAQQFGLPYVAAIRAGQLDPQQRMLRIKDHARASGFLYDSFDPVKVGGTGHTFDWSRFDRDVKGATLAGGLTPDNVKEAITLLRPWAVDVSSGVESAPGTKCPQLIARFIEQCKIADDSVQLSVANTR